MALPAIFFPVIRAAIETALKNGKTSPAGIAAEVEATMAADPVVKNEMNAEAPIQSRVGVGGASGFIGGLGILVPIIAGWFGYDIRPDRVIEIGFAVLAVWGPAYALYGRFKSGLKPLFSPKG